MNQVTVADSQKTKRLNRAFLKRIAEDLLSKRLELEDAEVGFDFVSDKRMAEINQQYLGHEGSTDVITFPYSESDGPLQGDIVICIDEAIRQSKSFKTTWQQEIVRYMVHGTLHLLGEDDLKPELRRKMKRKENRLVAELGKDLSFSEVEKK
jgi:probable rRNA maturation factor